MGILSTILGTGDIVTKGFELIDNIHTSDEELIGAKTKAKTDLLSAYAPFKVAQRYLALIFSGTFVVSYFLVLALVFMGKDVLHIRAVIAEFKIAWIMLTIVGFYFGGGAFDF